jgi:small subunit ribosomal protein S5
VLAEREALQEESFEDRVIRIDRTRKTVKGGRISSARVVVAIGDGKGSVGLGTGKALTVPDAINKAIKQARKNVIRVPLDGYTIPHEIQAKVGSAVILLKPASRGTGVVAGGATRQLIELSGIRDILTKSLGSGNVFNRAQACFKALQLLRNPQEVAEQRGISTEEMLGRSVVDGYVEEAATAAVVLEEEAEETEQVEEVLPAEEPVAAAETEVETVAETVEEEQAPAAEPAAAPEAVEETAAPAAEAEDVEESPTE